MNSKIEIYFNEENTSTKIVSGDIVAVKTLDTNRVYIAKVIIEHYEEDTNKKIVRFVALENNVIFNVLIDHGKYVYTGETHTTKYGGQIAIDSILDVEIKINKATK